MTGFMHQISWAGRRKTRVEVIKETPKKYQVRLLEEDPFKGNIGTVLYIPKYAFSRWN